jgi:hypothetical protein
MGGASANSYQQSPLWVRRQNDPLATEIDEILINDATTSACFTSGCSNQSPSYLALMQINGKYGFILVFTLGLTSAP